MNWRGLRYLPQFTQIIIIIIKNHNQTPQIVIFGIFGYAMTLTFWVQKPNQSIFDARCPTEKNA